MQNDVETVNLNHNQANCIVERADWGTNRYDNICTGTSTSDPWTPTEYAMAIGSIGFTTVLVVFMAVLFGTMLVKMFKD